MPPLPGLSLPLHRQPCGCVRHTLRAQQQVSLQHGSLPVYLSVSAERLKLCICSSSLTICQQEYTAADNSHCTRRCLPPPHQDESEGCVRQVGTLQTCSCNTAEAICHYTCLRRFFKHKQGCVSLTGALFLSPCRCE